MNTWIKKDLAYCWHPYAQMHDYEKNPPLCIESAKGIYLFDEQGKSYIDTISSWWCNIHGHNHPYINQAIQKQVNKMAHVMFGGLTHKPAIMLAEKLVGLTQGALSRVFYSDNGSTAVEVALKQSVQYWDLQGEPDKNQFLYLQNGYHGDTIGAMSVSGVSGFNSRFKSLFFESTQIPDPSEGESKSLAAVEAVLKQSHNRIAGFILEPLVMCAGGMRVYSESYLQNVRRLTQRYNVHLILDEIAVGFGRTGKWFAYHHADIVPDFLCISKGLTSGYLPLSATLTKESIYASFYGPYETDKTFFHGHTYTANPVACAAALASLALFEIEGVFKRLDMLAPIFQEKVRSLTAFKNIINPRGKGFIGAVTLESDNPRAGYSLYLNGLKEGLILRPLGNVIYFFMPLCINREEIDIVFRKTEKLLRV